MSQNLCSFRQIHAGFRKHCAIEARCIYYGTLPSYTEPIRRYYTSPSSEQEVPTSKDHSSKQFTTVGKIFNRCSVKTLAGNNKVSIIGLDDIGMATVFNLLTKKITNNICMIDLNEEILKAEDMDLQFSSLFLNNPKIVSSKDPVATRDSKICVLTTGTFKGREEDQSQYVARNAGIIRAIIPPLVKYSPDTIFILASDPVDVLSYVTWKLSGFPKHRIIGTGTLLDTARFRYLLSDKMGISPGCCHGYIIGQRGENSVPVWSGVSVAGVLLKDINPQIGTDQDPENWQELHRVVVKSDDLVRQLKGSISWTVALAIGEICSAIFNNANSVYPVSTYAKGEHSIRDEVFLSLPCVLGQSGVTDVIRQSLTDQEATLLRRSAENVAQLQECASKMLT